MTATPHPFRQLGLAARTPPFGALLALLLLALLANGPAWGARNTRQSSRKTTRVATPVTVALLPFSGPGAEAQRKQVRAALQKRRKEVRVLPASTVDAAVASAGAPQSEKQRQELARRLNATALVTGQVSADRKQLVLEVVSADTGKVLTSSTVRLRSASATQRAVWPQLSKALLSARPPSAPTESPPPVKSPDSAPPDAPSPTPPPPPAVATRPPEPPPPPRKLEPKAASTEATAPAKSTGAKPVALEVVLGGGTLGRRLGYTGEQTGRLLGYELMAAPSGRVSVSFFPGAIGSRGVLAHIGLHVEGTGTRALSTTPTGALFSASAYGLAAGLVGRVPLGASELLLEADYGQQTFAFRTYGGADLEGLPNMDYRYVRGGLGGRVQVTERLAVLLDAAWLAVLRTGEMGGPDYFPRASTNGLEGALTLGFGLNPTMELRLGGQYRRYLHTLNAQPEDVRVAGGAVDEYFTVQLGLATRVR
ncbi:hypothetical protein JQX13_46490 [Archangium violaceum]|uniref:hypothetical protein n=1 Tax=Archangium violaceum TaxID=83451 RepID=UPI00193B7C94|nr:hypothetical protein [Archangium violaceum]QRK07395.1 hypothetical protein JQX13_46490 [Archangium violaceum]